MKKLKDILTWEDTVLKNIKWRPKQTIIKDGRLDFDIHLPLTELFHRQAQQSFLAGVSQALVFMATHKGPQAITEAEVNIQMERWGLKDLWDAMKKKRDEGSR